MMNFALRTPGRRWRLDPHPAAESLHQLHDGDLEFIALASEWMPAPSRMRVWQRDRDVLFVGHHSIRDADGSALASDGPAAVMVEARSDDAQQEA